MKTQRVFELLHRLYAVERFSLANYLRYSRPWTTRQSRALLDTVMLVADDQQAAADRIGALIVERGGYAPGGSFPLRFTAYHDLSIDYLIGRVIDEQRRIVDELRSSARQLADDVAAQALVEEILGAETGHLQNLLELVDEGAVVAAEPVATEPIATEPQTGVSPSVTRGATDPSAAETLVTTAV